MKIRKAEKKDLADILRIYDHARKFMAQNGNPDQWADKYPSGERIVRDIEEQISYVCTEDRQIRGVFVFFEGEDPTYQVIENGSWRREQSYGVIHRVASDGTVRGVAEACFTYCKNQTGYLRIDTHKDNIPMQKVLEKNGFCQCGIIHTEDGSKRIAYDWMEERNK